MSFSGSIGDLNFYKWKNVDIIPKDEKLTIIKALDFVMNYRKEKYKKPPIATAKCPKVTKTRELKEVGDALGFAKGFFLESNASKKKT